MNQFKDTDEDSNRVANSINPNDTDEYGGDKKFSLDPSGRTQSQ